MAGPTRLELATSGVTGRRSNQLNYDPKAIKLNCRFQNAEFRLNRTLSVANPPRFANPQNLKFQSAI